MGKKKQKYLRGHRVFITKDLPKFMSHFERGCEAIVDHSYSDQYGGDDVESFALLLLEPYLYRVAWYKEDQLTLVNSDRDAGERLLQKYKEE